MNRVLVTGSSRGIGKAIAKCLKDENLFLSGRRFINTDNYFSYDLSDCDNCKLLFDKAKEYFDSKIDVLINCAGQYLYNPIEKVKTDEIDYMINLNFKSIYILSSLVIPYMKQNNWGRIINIGSISGMVGEANASLYSATKSALSGLTRALALETAQNNITVNQINPGWVDTPLADVLTKVTGATAGNVAIFNSDGTIADSTVAIATDEEFNTALNAIFPTVSGGGE